MNSLFMAHSDYRSNCKNMRKHLIGQTVAKILSKNNEK